MPFYRQAPSATSLHSGHLQICQFIVLSMNIICREDFMEPLVVRGDEGGAGLILCCECGLSIQPNAANMCVACIRSRIDITEDIPKQSLF